MALSRLLGERNIAFEDLSHAIPEPRLYFDTDHLNRSGATEFFTIRLRAILETYEEETACDCLP